MGTAQKAGVPIVPIVLMGTEDTTPTIAQVSLGGREMPVTLNALLLGPLLGSVAHLPAKIRVRVLPPVTFEGAHASHSLLMDHAESIRSQMQDVLDEMVADRESPWRG